MIEHRPFASLGGANHGWLDANFHFSFADYFDQRRLHWGKLRVWNDDKIAPRSGFPLMRTAWATRAAPSPAMCR